MSIQIHHGDIFFTTDKDTPVSCTDSYLVVKDGLVEGIYDKLPAQYENAPVIHHGRGVIIPAFSDLHVHASQYVERGLGMDCLLYDWLNDYTFPQEAKFADLDYARDVYDAFVDDLIAQGTFHVSAFATIHREATNYLFDRLQQKGLYAYVGKVNMDQGAPDYLCEDTEESLAETEKYLQEHVGADKVKPIITPDLHPPAAKS